MSKGVKPREVVAREKRTTVLKARDSMAKDQGFKVE
jgi:hypothetical protein